MLLASKYKTQLAFEHLKIMLWGLYCIIKLRIFGEMKVSVEKDLKLKYVLFFYENI